MRRLFAALLLLLSLMSPAQAALSAPEKAEIQELTQAIKHLVVAWEFLGQAAGFKTTASQAALSNIWSALMAPTTDLTDAYALLLHVNTAAPGDTAAYNTYEGTPRANLVSSAMTKLGTTGTAITAARALVTTAGNVTGQDTEYYIRLTTLDTQLGLSKTMLDGFNTTLAYATPRGTPWFPRVVTPHGDFIEATRMLHAATVKMIASMDWLRQVFNAAGQGEAELPTSSNVAFRLYLQASTELILKFTNVMHTWVDVPISGHCQFSPHHSMARIMEMLTNFGSESASMTTPFRGGEHAGAPYRFHMASSFNWDGGVNGFLEFLRVPMETRPLTWAKLNQGIARYFESWRAQDGGLWKIMDFPGGVTLHDFRVQAGRTNVSNVPPLCPDTAGNGGPPTVTLLYPANGQTVRGRLTISAECTDDIGDAPWGVGDKKTLCQRMDVKIDDATVATVTTLPYEYLWDTTLMSNGSHTLQACGFDAAGNSTCTSLPYPVTVAN